MPAPARDDAWPALPLDAWGLTTSPIPYGSRTFQIDFDFIDHEVVVRSSEPRVAISRTPSEVPDPIPFDEDETHRAYDREYANRFWRVLVQADRILKDFRARFVGKCSPVHFFWGAPDLAVTRFSGRPAPKHPGGIPNLPDSVTEEAYSEEVSSCGFWPGGGPVPYAAFYSYAYPEPPGCAASSILPGEAFYSPDLREFILPDDVVRQAESPDGTLLDFCETTYAAAAHLGRWDRTSLERGRVPKKPAGTNT